MSSKNGSAEVFGCGSSQEKPRVFGLSILVALMTLRTLTTSSLQMSFIGDLWAAGSAGAHDFPSCLDLFLHKVHHGKQRIPGAEQGPELVADVQTIPRIHHGPLIARDAMEVLLMLPVCSWATPRWSSKNRLDK